MYLDHCVAILNTHFVPLGHLAVGVVPISSKMRFQQHPGQLFVELLVYSSCGDPLAAREQVLDQGHVKAVVKMELQSCQVLGKAPSAHWLELVEEQPEQGLQKVLQVVGCFCQDLQLRVQEEIEVVGCFCQDLQLRIQEEIE